MARPDRPQLLTALAHAQGQVRRLIESHADFYPLYTDGGRWRHDKPAWTHWCDGFLPGMMWLFLETGVAGDPGYWRDRAEHYSQLIEPRKEDRDVHDLGFLFYHGTYRRWHQATIREGRPRRELDEVVVRAGEVLALRFKEKGQYLRSFVADESLFIDIMMNVPVIFHAAAARGDQRLRALAMSHCLTTRRCLVRGDGSTSHEGIFDTSTGEFLKQTTHQGYRGDSCWSRGLAWSLYGFGTCFEQTGDPRLLETAMRNADYYVAHTPADGVPPWDFDAPAEGPLARTRPDSSAAAIAAVGLLNLASMPAVAQSKRDEYRERALAAIATLVRPPYLQDDGAWEGILRRGVYHIHKQLGVDESVMWGEFFFVEALTKALALL
jgi:unsaturated chondroitin disaccharide hydrolase